MNYQEKIKKKLQGLKRLAESGVGGEKENARALYYELLEKHNFDENFDDISEEVFYFEFKYKNESEKELLSWIFYKVVGDETYYKYKDKRTKKLGVYCTEVEKTEIEFLFNFYNQILKDELRLFVKSFCLAQKLSPDETARCYEPPKEQIEDKNKSNFFKTDEEIEKEKEARKILGFMHNIEKRNPIRLGIEGD